GWRAGAQGSFAGEEYPSFGPPRNSRAKPAKAVWRTRRSAAGLLRPCADYKARGRARAAQQQPHPNHRTPAPESGSPARRAGERQRDHRISWARRLRRESLATVPRCNGVWQASLLLLTDTASIAILAEYARAYQHRD